MNEEEQQPIYGAGFWPGVLSRQVMIGPSAVGISCLTYEWHVSLEKINDGGTKKFVISAEMSSRYVFKDKHTLKIYLKKEDTEILSKAFTLEKFTEEQKFEIEYAHESTAEFDEVQVFATVQVDPENYYLSRWACEYNFKSSGKTHDVILVVGKTKFYLMRAYLATWSRYFDRLFFGNFKEKNQKEIKIDDVEVDDFELVLRLIHPQLYSELTEHNVMKVLKLADRFEIPTLMARCGTLLSNFDKCNQLEWLDRLELGESHNLVDLQIACFEKIHKMDATSRSEFFDKNRRRIQKLSENTVKNLF